MKLTNTHHICGFQKEFHFYVILNYNEILAKVELYLKSPTKKADINVRNWIQWLPVSHPLMNKVDWTFLYPQKRSPPHNPAPSRNLTVPSKPSSPCYPIKTVPPTIALPSCRNLTAPRSFLILLRSGPAGQTRLSDKWQRTNRL